MANAAPFTAIGREVHIKSFSRTNITQVQLNELVQLVQLTNTVTAIGTFAAGTSDVVNMIVEGPDFTTASGYTVANVAF